MSNSFHLGTIRRHIALARLSACKNAARTLTRLDSDADPTPEFISSLLSHRPLDMDRAHTDPQTRLAASPERIATLRSSGSGIRLDSIDAADAPIPDSQRIRPASQDELDTAFPRVESACRILESGPDYIAVWVAEGLHSVAGVWADKGLDFSQSTPARVGRSLISVSSSAIDIAEMMVHEACHQHFFALQHLARFDQSIGEHVYSPIAGVHRPVAKALLGYHAAANILHFYATLPAHLMDDHASSRHAFMQAMCAEFAQSLSSADSLTKDGLECRDVLNAFVQISGRD